MLRHRNSLVVECLNRRYFGSAAGRWKMREPSGKATDNSCFFQVRFLATKAPRQRLKNWVTHRRVLQLSALVPQILKYLLSKTKWKYLLRNTQNAFFFKKDFFYFLFFGVLYCTENILFSKDDTHSSESSTAAPRRRRDRPRGALA
jgi:hypothetical protein